LHHFTRLSVYVQTLEYHMLSVVNWQASWHWSILLQAGVRKWGRVLETDWYCFRIVASEIVHWWGCQVQTY